MENYLLPSRGDVDYFDDMIHLLGIQLPCDRTKLVSFTCCLAYMCQYITAEELSVYVSSDFGKDAMRRRFARLVSAGYLRADKFRFPDGHSRTAYCLTKKGIEAAGGYFPREAYHEVKVRRSGGYVPEHDYSCGINVLSALYARIPFFWEKEYVLTGVYKKLRSVRSDCVFVTRYENPNILFVEQDMGTESTATLIDKIGAYGDHGVQSDDMCRLIFSCRCLPSQDYSSTLFNQGWVRNLMELVGDMDFYDYYLSGSFDHSTRLLLKKFLVLLGVCSASVDFNSVHASTELTKNPVPFGRAEFLDYLDSLDAFCNPYQMMYQNKLQAENSFSTLFAMASALSRLLLSAEELGKSDEVSTILGGLPVFVVPTHLFARRIRNVVPAYFSLPTYQKGLIGAYYGVPTLFYDRLDLGVGSLESLFSVTIRDCYLIYEPCEEATSGFLSMRGYTQWKKLVDETDSSGARVNKLFFRSAVGLKKVEGAYLMSYSSSSFSCEDPFFRALGSRCANYEAENSILDETEFRDLNTGEVPCKVGVVCSTSVCNLSALMCAHYLMSYEKELSYDYIHFIFECDNKEQMKKIAVLLGFDKCYDDYLEKKGVQVSFSLAEDKTLYRVYGYGDGVLTPDDIVFPISPILDKEKDVQNLSELLG